MSFQKIKLIKTKKIKINFYIIIIFLVLILIALFSAVNLFTVVELRKQVNLILDDASKAGYLKPEKSQLIIPTQSIVISTTTPVNSEINLATSTYIQKYSNVTSEPFFGSSLIDIAKTNMRLDDSVTAMTFQPVYNLSYEKNCDQPLCGLREQNNPSCLPHGCLSEKDNQIYFQEKKINLPSELENKKIVSITFNPLETKWIIGIVVSEEGQEVGYAYFFDEIKLTPIITSNTPQQIKTNYGYGGGQISAGGGDKQFIIFYSGYEGIAYLYNNGEWQNLSLYFGLRVTKGGFKSKIIRGGNGKSANWYVCSDDLMKPKLIKLWQNGTKNIQGSIDLTSILESGAAICTPRSNREISIARNFSGNSSLYVFKDNGFNNKGIYRYQSSNLSDFKDKKIDSVNLGAYTINALPDSYSLMVSADDVSWQPNVSGETILNNEKSLDTFYIKTEFKSADTEYSPWFGGIELISYDASDK